MASSFPLVLWLAALATLFAAATIDLKERRIPNGSVLVILVLGMSLRLFAERGSLWLSLLIAGLIFVVGAWLTQRDLIGGGDAKMLSAVTVLVPPMVVPGLLLCVAMAGGLLSIFYMSAGWLVRRNGGAMLSPAQPHPGASEFDHIVRIEVARMQTNEPMPYGVAIFGGVVGFLLIGIMTCISATRCSL